MPVQLPPNPATNQAIADSFHQMHILYVEDDDDLREGMTELLDDGSRSVVGCASAQRALELFRAHRFDVVITDVGLPETSGIELARTLLDQQPSLPVVLCSGFEVSREAQGLGSNVHLLPKPFDAEMLEVVLAKLAIEPVPLLGR